LNNFDKIPRNAINTTTATVQAAGYQELTLLPWNKNGNMSIQINLNAVPTNTLWTEIYMSTNSGFTPSKYNMVASTFLNGTPVLYLNNANLITIKNFNKKGYGGFGSGASEPFLYLVSSTGNKFINFNYDFNYCNFSLVNGSNLSNDNLFHNFTINKLRSYLATGYLLATLNNSGNYTFQNIKCDNTDIPLNNQFLNCIFKGVPGADTVTTTPFANTTDGVAVAYTTVYDTIFNELYHNNGKGVLLLNFNASAKEQKPYIQYKDAFFDNTGKLYFLSKESYIEYTWPHKIYGVTGFQNLNPVVSTVDLGNNALTGYMIKKEYSLSTNNVNWSNYKVAKKENLSGETLDAIHGFYLKLKLTAQVGVVFDGQTINFVGGETVVFESGGVERGAATVIDFEDQGATGTLILSGETGFPLDNNNIRLNSVVGSTYALVNHPSKNGYFPQATSYIQGMEIFTFTNQSVSYPISYPNITLTNLQHNSEIRIYRSDNGEEIAGIENNSGSTFITNYEYFGNDIDVDIIIMSLGYQYFRLNNITLGENGINIPIQQTLDRVYLNP
jgi:hypothetical protein